MQEKQRFWTKGPRDTPFIGLLGLAVYKTGTGTRTLGTSSMGRGDVWDGGCGTSNTGTSNTGTRGTLMIIAKVCG